MHGQQNIKILRELSIRRWKNLLSMSKFIPLLLAIKHIISSSLTPLS